MLQVKSYLDRVKKEVSKQFSSFYLIWDFCVEISEGGVVIFQGYVVIEGYSEGMWVEQIKYKFLLNFEVLWGNQFFVYLIYVLFVNVFSESVITY